MLIIKSFHIIAMVAWFAGLFYLPRLFVYHAAAHDAISLERFKIMERRLFRAIMWPAALLTTVLGVGLMTYNLSYYSSARWMQAKLMLVAILWAYHFVCGGMVKRFARGENTHAPRYYRVFNEVPTLLLIGVVLLVVLKPTLL
ncbi:MAG TPA: protoporphyrinogen oxidase HemJ [Legionella sp.]|nr:protoporphyrinogen oxidase HemJ [Legionella sp.]